MRYTLLFNAPKLIKPKKYIVCCDRASVGSYRRDLCVCMVHESSAWTDTRRANTLRTSSRSHVKDTPGKRTSLKNTVCGDSSCLENVFKYLLGW